jgi:hypothetical protein
MERDEGYVQGIQGDGLVVNKAAKSLMTVCERATTREADAGVADTPGPFWGCLP